MSNHTTLPSPHTFINKWNKPYLPLFHNCGASQPFWARAFSKECVRAVQPMHLFSLVFAKVDKFNSKSNWCCWKILTKYTFSCRNTYLQLLFRTVYFVLNCMLKKPCLWPVLISRYGVDRTISWLMASVIGLLYCWWVDGCARLPRAATDAGSIRLQAGQATTHSLTVLDVMTQWGIVNSPRLAPYPWFSHGVSPSRFESDTAGFP